MKQRIKSLALLLFCLTSLFFGSVQASAASSSKTTKLPTEKQIHKWADSMLKTAQKRNPLSITASVPLDGKLILAYHNVEKSEGCHVYGKYDIKHEKYEDPFPDNPFFQPVSYDGTTIYDYPPSVWANTQKECDYLIVFGGFEESREKNYYSGGIDRVSVETEVYVIDTKKSRIVDVELIGINIPAPITDHTTGYVYKEEAEKYIQYLLTGIEPD